MSEAMSFPMLLELWTVPDHFSQTVSLSTWVYSNFSPVAIILQMYQWKKKKVKKKEKAFCKMCLMPFAFERWLADLSAEARLLVEKILWSKGNGLLSTLIHLFSGLWYAMKRGLEAVLLHLIKAKDKLSCLKAGICIYNPCVIDLAKLPG